MRERFGRGAAIELLAGDPDVQVGDEVRRRGVERPHELAFLVTKAG